MRDGLRTKMQNSGKNLYAINAQNIEEDSHESEDAIDLNDISANID